jgi:hypothetical protein
MIIKLKEEARAHGDCRASEKKICITYKTPSTGVTLINKNKSVAKSN